MASVFDEHVERRGTRCAKWDSFDRIYQIPDLIHVGCADMDFRAPAPLLKRLHELLAIATSLMIFTRLFSASIRIIITVRSLKSRLYFAHESILPVVCVLRPLPVHTMRS